MSDKTLRLLVIDDHPLFSEGLQFLLTELSDQVEIYAARTAEEGLRIAASQKQLDLVLLDLNLPGMHGSIALKAFAQQFPFLPVVMISASQNESDMQMALNNGAMGYISKTSKSKVMMQALRLVLDGGVYVPPELVCSSWRGSNRAEVKSDETAALSSQNTRGELLDSIAHANGLTRRQLEVLTYIAEGKSNKEIARLLEIAEATTKAHVTAVLKALNVDNRTKAVSVAQKMGITSFS